MIHTSIDQNLLLRAQIAEQKLQLIHSSFFWKVTKPIRLILKKIGYTGQLESKAAEKTLSNKQQIKVLNEIKPKIKLIFGQEKLNSGKVAVLAHWSELGVIDQSTRLLVDEIVKNGYELVLVSACENLELEKDFLSQYPNLKILSKPNIGYDFGSWLAALTFFPEIYNSEELILLNDSCYGPFGHLERILKDLQNSKFDITSLTDSLKFNYHLQSYFLHFNSTALKVENLRKFFNELPIIDNKLGMIGQYEIAFTATMQNEGVRCGALFPWNLIAKPFENPTIDTALELLEIGFPFVKKESIRLSGSKYRKLLLTRIREDHSDFAYLMNHVN